MKNYNYRKKNIFINKGYSTRKDSNENEINNKYYIPKLRRDSTVGIKYSWSQKIYGNLALTNRDTNKNNKKNFQSYINDNPSTKFNHNLKLNPINKKKLFENKELNKYSLDLNDNKNNFNNTKTFKKTINQSSQSDFFFDNEDQDNKLIKEHFLKIDNLLKKKISIIKRPKLRKINFNLNKEKNNFISNLLKSNYNDIFDRQYMKKLKPLQYYFKYLGNKNKKISIDNNNNISSRTLNTKTRNNSLIIPKSYSSEEKSEYDIINNLENNKVVFYANKLIIDDNISKNNNNKSFLIKGKNDIIPNYSKILINKNNILGNKYKYRYNSMNIKNQNAKKITFFSSDKMKLLSKKGFEKLINRKLGSLSREIKHVVRIIEDNKKNFKKIMELNAQVYVNNKKVALNEDNLF